MKKVKKKTQENILNTKQTLLTMAYPKICEKLCNQMNKMKDTIMMKHRMK